MVAQGYIGRNPGDSSVIISRQSFTASGITTDFTFASGYTVGYFDLYINGVRLIEGTDYTASDSATFTVMNGGAQNGDVLEGVAYKAFNLGNASRIGIQSAGIAIGNAEILNFVGTGNTFAVNGTTIDVSISGGAGAGGTWTTYDSNTGITTTKKVKIDNSLEVTGVTTSTGGFVGALTGNASSATVLASSRNIGGVAFNGSGDINLPGVNEAGTQNTSGTAAGLSGTPDITVRNVTGLAATFTGVATFDGATNLINGSNTLNFNTNTGQEGQLYATSDYFYINSSATNGMLVQANTIAIRSGTGGKNYLTASINNGALLYHNDVKKFETTADGIAVAGIVTATSGIVTYYGDGSQLSGISAGIATEALVANNSVVTLDLTKQDHKITATGICTITVTGGTEANSHTVRLINSGIATVGFSTYFLFPSGSTPSLPEADGSISLLSFTVNRVGAGGTQLLTGASLNYI